MTLSPKTQDRLRRVVRQLTGEIVTAYEDDADMLELMSEAELRRMVVGYVEGLSWLSRGVRRTE